MNNALSLLWLAAVLVAIPVVLWLLKRTPLVRGQHAPGAPRMVATLPLSPGQRLVTVEVGAGEARQWLVLGVGPQGIQTLHTMVAGHELPSHSGAMPLTPRASQHGGLGSRHGLAGHGVTSSTSHTVSNTDSNTLSQMANKSASKSATGAAGPSAIGATFGQLLQRLRTPPAKTPGSGSRGTGKPPRPANPGDHER